ncbi:MAG: radical SAM protein [Candidatus Alcyoniella australis]|nr:radical SAM protein [Candidatus Alcyoniella australis]
MSERWGGKVIFFPGRSPGAAARLGRYVELLRCVPTSELAIKAAARLAARVAPRLLPFPRYLHVEITNRCNMRCVMCPREQMDRPTGLIDQGLFRRIVDQAAQHANLIEGVALMGLGEPLLHPQFVELTKLAADAGAPHLYTSTNAALLDQAMARRLLESQALERIIFSLDGTKPETYEAIRRHGDFAAVTSNIRGFLAAKAACGASLPRTTLQILVMDSTSDELEPFLEQWVPLLGPTDDILVKEVDTFGGQVEDRRVVDRTPAKRFACRQLYKDMSISWDGRVTVCCKDVLYRLEVGNVRDSTLEQLWRCAGWQRIRELHEQGRWDELTPCDGCNEWYL